MKRFHQLVALTLVLAITTSSIYGQDLYNQEDESHSSAYMQSQNTAHWSVYVPIAILIGAAIWFGLADRKHEKHDSNDSQDGLGSMANSKRRYNDSDSHRSHSHSRPHSRSSSKQSKGSYSH